MTELAVVIMALDDEQRAVLQMQVDSTTLARTVQSLSSFPVGASDALLRRVHDSHPDVIMVDVPSMNGGAALRAIELLHQEMPKSAIFAIGEMSQPQTIVSVMRAGAREYLERPTTTSALLEALVRLATAQRKSRSNEQRGKVFVMLNARGGSGATTVAVNTAVALQASKGNVALIDVAPLGHVAIQLNARPTFTLGDAVRNLHRLDASLLESYMFQHEGLHVLAGLTDPLQELGTGEFARLFDLLVNQYRYVVVDVSSRLDAWTRVACDLADKVLLVTQTDVASLWSAARIREFLGEGTDSKRVSIVLNRFRKITGFGESDLESAVGAKILFKLPNQYPVVSAAIDRGYPVVQQNHSEVARAFVALANALAQPEEAKHKSWALFKTAS